MARPLDIDHPSHTPTTLKELKMTAEEIGVKAALGLLPFATNAEYAGRNLDAVLANLKSRPGFSEAMGAGTVVLEDARKALAFRSRRCIWKVP